MSAKRADFTAIGQRFGIDPVVARIIRNRDVIGEEAVDAYLNGGVELLHDPRLLKGCQEAAQLLLDKIRQRKKIRIIGDYDIDGVNATYILYEGIQTCGGDVDYEIPDRMKDGYGLNIQLIELAVREQVDTVITCDNGISALEEVAYGKEKGLTVIVTDHHEPLFEETQQGRIYHLPAADVIVNPKQPGCPYPYKKLCGAAVAWKVIWELYRIRGIDLKELDSMIQYAAFATIGDVMDLDGENRVIVKEGLRRLHHTQNPGLQALAKINGLEIGSISSYHIGFVLGPCINASGRLDTARRSVRLLMSSSMDEAMDLARELKELNDERKYLTQKAVEDACSLIESGIWKNDRVLVVYLPDCHESIAGIVAGKLRERYYRPTFVVTRGEMCAKGSGRSIEGYSMFEEMVKCQDLFLKFGGHPMAAGFSLEEGRVEEMRTRLNESCTLSENDLKEKVSIDVPMPLDYISERLVEELSLLEPFGKGNEKPLFAEAHLRLLSARILGANKNVLKLRIMNRAGRMMDAMFFGDPQEMLQYLSSRYGNQSVQSLLYGDGRGMELDLTYYPSVNEYMGKRTLQIVIKNFR